MDDTQDGSGLDQLDEKARRFEGQRPRLAGIARRMLGSTADADDAVQDTWLRYARTDTADVENVEGWLTTVLSRICLSRLRTRSTRRESSFDDHLPDPVVTFDPPAGPEDAAVAADAVGVALLVVLDALDPAERLAFVLHDVFAVPFDQIAELVGRSPAAARQLASRARRRVQDTEAATATDLAARRRVVDAFFAAAMGGDLGALLDVLDPDVVARSDRGTGALQIARGADAVATSAMSYAIPRAELVPVLVDGHPGVVVVVGGRVAAVMGFTVVDGRVRAIDAITDRNRLGALVPDLGSS